MESLQRAVMHCSSDRLWNNTHTNRVIRTTRCGWHQSYLASSRSMACVPCAVTFQRKDSIGPTRAMDQTGSEGELIKPDLCAWSCWLRIQVGWWRYGVVFPFLLTFAVFSSKDVFSKNFAILEFRHSCLFLRRSPIQRNAQLKGVVDLVSLTKPLQSDLFADSKLIGDSPITQINCSLDP